MKTFAGAMSAVLLLALHTCASAAPLYKCEIGGVLAFQDTPCPPLKAKQKIACADADGFAVYQDTLEQACANAPAGAATTNDFSADKKPKSTSTKPTGNATTRKTPSDKEI